MDEFRTDGVVAIARGGGELACRLVERKRKKIRLALGSPGHPGLPRRDPGTLPRIESGQDFDSGVAGVDDKRDVPHGS